MKTKLEILKIREKVIDATRKFLKKEGFLEVTTPILVPALPAESHLEIFETTLLDRNRKQSTRYLITSPEVALKKLLCQGVGSCFEITKSFRNMENKSSTHNPEFTILEWYRVSADYMDMMEDVEKLILTINKIINQNNPFILPIFCHSDESQNPNQNIDSGFRRNDMVDKINLTLPWPRMTIREALQKYSDFDLNNAFEFDQMKKIFFKKGYKFEKSTTWEQMFDQIFLNEVENKLREIATPIILYDYPAKMAMLANKKEDDARYAKRFEFYIRGLELGDAYDELRDPIEQEKRFKEEEKIINSSGKTKFAVDWQFIEYLKSPGLPKCSGIAVGIDRLVMLFAGCDNIQEVI